MKKNFDRFCCRNTFFHKIIQRDEELILKSTLYTYIVRGEVWMSVVKTFKMTTEKHIRAKVTVLMRRTHATFVDVFCFRCIKHDLKYTDDKIVLKAAMH